MKPRERECDVCNNTEYEQTHQYKSEKYKVTVEAHAWWCEICKEEKMSPRQISELDQNILKAVFNRHNELLEQANKLADSLKYCCDCESPTETCGSCVRYTEWKQFKKENGL